MSPIEYGLDDVNSYDRLDGHDYAQGFADIEKAPSISRLIGPLELQQMLVTVQRWTWGGKVKSDMTTTVRKL